MLRENIKQLYEYHKMLATTVQHIVITCHYANHRHGESFGHGSVDHFHYIVMNMLEHAGTDGHLHAWTSTWDGPPCACHWDHAGCPRRFQSEQSVRSGDLKMPKCWENCWNVSMMHQWPMDANGFLYSGVCRTGSSFSIYMLIELSKHRSGMFWICLDTNRRAFD